MYLFGFRYSFAPLRVFWTTAAYFRTFSNNETFLASFYCHIDKASTVFFASAARLARFGALVLSACALLLSACALFFITFWARTQLMWRYSAWGLRMRSLAFWESFISLSVFCLFTTFAYYPSQQSPASWQIQEYAR